MLSLHEIIPANFELEVGSLAPGSLRVVRFEGTETLSQPFRFELELASTDSEVVFEDIVGQEAAFVWKGPEAERRVLGVLSHFEQTGKGRRLTYYRARLVPRIWTLGLHRGSRIFQNLSVPEIVRMVFQAHGLLAGKVRFSLAKSYRPLEYCVQYRESDLDFVSRLLEEAGIYYFEDGADESQVLVLADDLAANLPLDGDPRVPYREEGSGVTTAEHVSRFRYTQQVGTSSVTLRDFDFKRPALRLETRVTSEATPRRDWYDHPGGFHELRLGEEAARVRLEELRALREQGSGRSTCWRFWPGRRFFLDQHARSDFNQEYLLVQLQHRGEQPHVLEDEADGGHEAALYENHFTCIPASTPYRPPRLTRRPRIEGPQTAIVVGPPGEEIHTDAHGRVKLHFHWDREGKRDEHDSCWIRVSQGWSGAGWGMMFLPRIGQEVVVDFLDGDPDRPMIIGRVYNGEQPTPYTLPEEKTKSTIRSSSSPGGDGFNELRFEDGAGREEIYLHGQKDWNIVLENDKTEAVGRDEAKSVGQDRRRHVARDEGVEIGRDRTKVVGGTERETIRQDKVIQVWGHHREEIDGDMSQSVYRSKNESIVEVKTLTVGGAYLVTVGAAMNESIAGARTEEIGASKLEIVADQKTERIGGTKSLSTGGDLAIKVGACHSLLVEENASANIKQSLAVATGETIKVEATAGIVIQSGADIVLKAGKSRIVLKQDGKIEIEGDRLSLKASADVKIKGATVAIN